MPAKSLADYELDVRVAKADARDRYRRAVQRARQQLVRECAQADALLAAAHDTQRRAVEVVDGIRERYHGMGPIPLQEEYSRLAYMLTPAYAVYTNPREKARTTILVRMIREELVQRGLDVS